MSKLRVVYDTNMWIDYFDIFQGYNEITMNDDERAEKRHKKALQCHEICSKFYDIIYTKDTLSEFVDVLSKKPVDIIKTSSNYLAQYMTKNFQDGKAQLEYFKKHFMSFEEEEKAFGKGFMKGLIGEDYETLDKQELHDKWINKGFFYEKIFLSKEEVEEYVGIIKSDSIEIKDFNHSQHKDNLRLQNIITPPLSKTDQDDQKFFSLAIMHNASIVSSDRHMTQYYQNIDEELKHLKAQHPDKYTMNPKYLNGIDIHKAIIPDINTVPPGNIVNGMSALKKDFEKLIMAVKNTHSYAEIVELLEYKNIDINAQNPDGNSALMMACKMGKPDIIDLLLTYDANFNIQNSDGKTAMMLILEQETTSQNIGMQTKIINSLLSAKIPRNPENEMSDYISINPYLKDKDEKTIEDYFNAKKIDNLQLKKLRSSFTSQLQKAKDVFEKQQGASPLTQNPTRWSEKTENDLAEIQ